MSKKYGLYILVIGFVFCFSQSVKAEKSEKAESGLVGWWKFDEGSGEILHDSSGNGNDGKIYGAKWVKGKIGSALLFDGKDDYVDCLNTVSTQLDKTLTISAWVNIPESAVKLKKNNWYFVSRHDWDVGLGDSLIPFFDSWNAIGNKRIKVSAERKIPIDEWVHLVAVYSVENEVMEFYINGEKTNYERRTDGGTGGFLHWPLMFGRESLEYSGAYLKGADDVLNFNGGLDEIRIYSRALSGDEIRKNYEEVAGVKSLSYSLNLGFLKILPLYGQKKLMVELDVKSLGKDINSEEIKLEINLSDESKVIKHRELNVKGAFGQYQVIFDMKDVGSGSYRVKGIIRDDKGKEISNECIKDFSWMPKELEKFKWLNSKEGITDEVLSPWTPIEVEQNKGLNVKVWGRTYEFKDSPFPSIIETKGNSILTSPIRVMAKVDGKEINLKWESFKIEKQTPCIVDFVQNASGKRLNLSAKTHIEYDGMVRIDWKITPKDILKLEELTFDIPMFKKHAKYIYTKDFHCTVGYIPKDGWSTSFIPMIWLGDEDLGLQWFCESEKDWYNVKQTKCIEILPEGEVVKLRLHLVDKPITMKPGKRVEHELGIPIMQPDDDVVELSYTFGLQATPVKPVTKDVWDYRFADGGSFSFDEPRSRSANKFNIPESTIDSLAKSGVKTICFYDTWTDTYSITSTPYENELKKIVKDFHKRGIQVLLYLHNVIPNIIPEWQLFNEEVMLIPKNVWDYSNYAPMLVHQAYQFCSASVWSDYLVDGIAKTMIGDYDIDGVYLDGTTQTWGGCKNILHGCGYIGIDGKVKRTYALFACRETMRRIYSAIKQRKPDGQVNFHNSTEMFAPVLSWVTGYWDGEHLGVVMMIRGLSKKSPSLKKIPLDYFRTEFMGHQWGVGAEFLEYMWTDDNKESLALSLLHDVPIRLAHVMSPMWKLRDEFKIKEAEWLPYWRNKEYVTIKPEDKDVYVSLYKHPKNGVLAIVSNLGETDAKDVVVQLNLKNLKLKDDKISAHIYERHKDNVNVLVLTDKKNINIGSDGKFDLNLSAYKFEIIWVKD